MFRQSFVLRALRCSAALLLSLASACGSAPDEAAPKPDDQQPPGWDSELAIAEASDLNPDPHIFETNLSAQVTNLELLPGKLTPVWTYNGQLPGPLIRVNSGDRLIVHFTNNLPEATTIHWHGIRLPNAMDGVPDVTQGEVPPGASFDYDFVVPDAGLFWYHPHVASAAQVGFGLYGPILVKDPSEAKDLGDELVLVLSDMSLADDGSFVSPNTGGGIGTLFGREGSTLLVNGKVNPTLRARAGRRQRWRVLNAARSRYYQLALQGQSFTRIGGDGGFLAAPQAVDTIVLTPAQRADVVFDLATTPGSTTAVNWVPYDRGYGSTEFRTPETVFQLETSTQTPLSPTPLPALARAITPIDVSRATAQSLSLTRNDQNGSLVLGINGVPGSQADPIMVALGDTQVWTLKNTIDWAHPFHLHGFFFQVLDVNGVAPGVLEWRDTVDVPVDATVRIAVSFDERPGMWMFHCHVLDHADAGMMGMIHLH